jgi:hypothetical protein
MFDPSEPAPAGRPLLAAATDHGGPAPAPTVVSGGMDARRLLHHAREQVASAVHDGRSLRDIDRGLIEPQALSRDARDALWLYAWTTLERRQIRQWARSWRRVP